MHTLHNRNQGIHCHSYVVCLFFIVPDSVEPPSAFQIRIIYVNLRVLQLEIIFECLLDRRFVSFQSQQRVVSATLRVWVLIFHLIPCISQAAIEYGEVFRDEILIEVAFNDQWFVLIWCLLDLLSEGLFLLAVCREIQVEEKLFPFAFDCLEAVQSEVRLVWTSCNFKVNGVQFFGFPFQDVLACARVVRAIIFSED